MGKRRKEGPQADKFNPNIASEDEEEEENENNFEKEPLRPEEIANIKARKKLIATRRIASGTPVNGSATVTSSFGFTPFAPFNPSATNTDSDNKPSVFSGFKGFMSAAAKPAVPGSSSTITLTTTTTNGASSETAPRPTLTISEPTKPPAISLSTTKPSESTTPFFKPSETFTTPKPDTSTTASTAASAASASAANNLSHSNICETDLNFMNDLNDLYERYYGSIKEKNFTIPSDILNGSDFVFEQESSQDGLAKKPDEEDESKKKYAYLLADLNKHCSKWISKHVEENPLVILTPVFVDYFAYLILLEKNFFPSTFSAKKEKPLNNGTSAPVSTTSTTASLTTSTASPLFKFGLSTNGGAEQATLSTITTAPSFASTTTTAAAATNKNGTDSDSHKNLNNGFKFAPLATAHINGLSKPEETMKKTSEELAESEEKNLEQSSKTFASLITKTPFTQIPLPTSSFLFKPTSEPSSTTDNKKDTTDSTKETPSSDTTSKISLPSQETSSLFKFGQSIGSSTTTSENKPAATLTAPTETTTTNTMTKFSLFSSTTTPTFKFGDLSKPAQAVSTPAVSSAAATTTTISPSSQTTSLFSKPTESTNVETPKTSNFFANLSKPTTTTTPPAGATTTSTTTTSTVPTFSSLLSGTTSSTMFKPFSSNLDQTASSTGTTTSTTTSSIFSSLNAPSTTGTSTSTPFFSFQSNLGGAKPSIFGQSTATNLFSGAVAPASAEGEEAGEEEYEPPKPEASDVKEEGSVFEKRIKLYYFSEKEKKFTDRGVGNLFLKPINNGESTQLIVRADTSLANILLNVKLTKMFPITKLGAKDVSYVCVPNPPIPNVDSKVPCKFLFKVKTEDDAKELLDKLNEFKK